jgi:hypothetical protein
VGTRRERVILQLDDKYSAGIAKAAAATALLNRELEKLDRNSAAVSIRARQMSDQDMPAMARKADQAGNSIDRLSGRLGLMAKGIGALGPAMAPLSTAAVAGLAGIASQAGFAAIALGVLVGSVNGVGDALGAVNKYVLDPSEEHLKAMNIAMESIGPHAQAAVMAMHQLGPEMKSIRDAGMEGFFPGFIESLDWLEVMAPRFADIFGSIGKAWGDLFASGSADLASDEWAGFFDFIEREAGPALTTLGHTVGNVTKGLAELWMAMDPLNDDFAAGLLNASEGFERWAEGLSKTEGFQEFIAYVREAGPQVMETIGSIADALLQIGEAAAPLGGPVLHAIEGIADAVAAIADSPLGTPIMTMVTALSAASLAMNAFNKVAGVSFVSKRGGSLRTGIQAVTRDLEILASTSMVAGAKTEAAMARTGAAASRLRLSAVRAGAGAAAIGAGYAGIESGLIGTNAIMGASIGLMVGPWGAAVGGGAGMLLDLRDAANSAEGAIKTMNEAIASGSSVEIGRALDALAAQSEDFKDKTSKLEAAVKLIPVAGAYLGAKVGGDRDDGRADLEAARRRGEAAEKAALAAELAASQAAFTHTGRVKELVGAFHALGAEGDRTASAVDRLKSALDSLLGPKMNLSAATDAWTQSLHDLNGDLSENSRTLVGNSNAALQNRGAIRSRVTALSDMLKAQGDAGVSSEVMSATLRNGIRNLVATGEAAGMSGREIRTYARQLGLTPKVIRTLIEAETKQATDKILTFREYLNSLKDKTVHVNVLTGYGNAAKQNNNMYHLPGMDRSADGSTVPKTGLPYADRHPYLLADGEEVISNRHGQADRHRGLLKAINAGRLADGGTAGRSGGSNSRTSDPGIRSLEQQAQAAAYQLAKMNREADSHVTKKERREQRREDRRQALEARIEKAWAERERRLQARLGPLEDALQNLESRADSLADAIKSKLTTSLFGDGAPKTSAEDLARQMPGFDQMDPAAQQAWIDAIGNTQQQWSQNAWKSTLQSDIDNAHLMLQYEKQLRDKGLDGGALEDLLGTADLATIAQFAQMSTAEIQQYETLWNKRDQLTSGAGQAGAQAALGAEMKGVRHDIQALKKSIEVVAPKAIGAEIRHVGGNAARR